jgi:adenosylcobyric acid synthase
MLHGGNLREYSEISGRKEIIDFSANINPIGMPSWVRPMILKSVSKIPHYPDPNHKKILASMASYYQISPNQILLSNGIAESLMFLPWAFKIKSALAFGPGFSEYKRGVEANAGSIDFIPMVLANNKGEEYFSFDLQRLEDKLKGKTDALYLNNPHNPTGAKINSSSILELTQKYPQVLFIIDEAFIGFTSDPGLFGLAPKYKNVLVLKSYTKILGTPGLRIGAISGNEDLLNSLGKFLPRWNINTFAGEILNRYYSLNPDDFLKETLTELESLRSNFFSALNDFPLKVFPSESNFHLLKCNSNCALELFSYLLRNHGIALRTCESFPPLDQKKFLRVAIRPLKEQEALMVGMCGFFKKKKIIKKKTPAIMIQGTTSNAGKSLITTAVCRISLQIAKYGA